VGGALMIAAPDRGTGVWARLASLEGEVVQCLPRGRFLVLAVTEAGVYVRSGAWRTMLLSRLALEKAMPFVAAGEAPPSRLRASTRLSAVLRAAGVGPPQ
jgi:hypothetical protein